MHARTQDLNRRRAHLQRLAQLGLLGALTLGSLAACGRKSGNQAQALAAGATVLALGDSLTFGSGAAPEQAWPAQLQRRSGWKLVNAGVPGETSTQIAARLPGLLDEHAPALVILCAGGNDFLQQQSATLTQGQLQAMLALLKSRQVPVLLVAVPQLSLMTAVTAKFKDHPLFEQVAGQAKVPLLANAWSEVLSQPALRADQVHANAQGYALFTDTLEARLRSLGFLR